MTQQQEHKTVFISYRREAAKYFALLVYKDLIANGYDAFIDIEGIDNGQFDTIILRQIEARAHFLIILTPGTVERCAEPGDWLRKEIEYAIDKQRNIVPLLVDCFKFTGTEQYLTGKLHELPSYNGLPIFREYFDEGMARLRDRYLKQPVYGEVMPTPARDQPEVAQKIAEVAAQPTPTTQELSAEEFLNRGVQKQFEDEHEAAIANYNEAIRLNPLYAEAYNNRGIALSAKGDLDGAILDFDEAICLNPHDAVKRANRGETKRRKGDLNGAIIDLDEAIRLDPHFAIAYINRGTARYDKANIDGAIADFDEGIRLNPQYAAAYYNRGTAYYHEGKYESAIADYNKGICLNPQYVNVYGNRAESYFAKNDFKKALKDFRYVNALRPGDNLILAGLAITHHALGEKAEAKRFWQTLLAQDERYRDADWVGKELNWAEPLIEAARKLIAEL